MLEVTIVTAPGADPFSTVIDDGRDAWRRIELAGCDCRPPWEARHFNWEAAS